MLLAVVQLLVDQRSVAVAGSAAACASHGSDITGHVRGTLSDDKKRLDVTLTNDSFRLTAVGVEGGGGVELYTSGPFTGLTAPTNPGGNTPGIGGWFACGERTSQPPVSPPGEPPTPTGSLQPTGTPSAPDDPTGSPDPTRSSPEPTSPRTDSPTGSPDPTGQPTASPPVPTSIPAGLPTSPDGGAGGGVLVAVGLGVMAAGGAVLLVRLRRADA